ncbi:MAG: caspase family protein [Deltaproteobacteria bacterium]|nr:caspase family protein [Deltaproteobacteria bacterium]
MTLDRRVRCLWRAAVALLALLAAGGLGATTPAGVANAGEIVRSGEIAQGLTKGFRVTLPAIQFEFDSDRLTASAQTQLAELVKALGAESLQSRSFSIQGHTDNTGSEEYNRSLSLRRARAVKRRIVDATGIAAERLVEVGFGESLPIRGVPPEDPRNRRVEIVNLGVVTPPSASGKRALLIGVDAYRHLTGLLGAPVNDAREMRAFLIRQLGYHYEDVRLLLDADATRSRILGAIQDWLVDGTKPGDEVFLYFSGHGSQQRDSGGDEPDGRDETLVPADAALGGRGELAGTITDDEMAALLGRLAGRRVHVVLDSGHAGAAAGSPGEPMYVKSPRLPDGASDRVAATKSIGPSAGAGERESFLASIHPGVTVWAASRVGQPALVAREVSAWPGGSVDRGSVFTRLFLRGVDGGKADADMDGTVTVRELRRYLVDAANAYCQRHVADCAGGLTPQLFASAERLDEPVFASANAMGLSATASFVRELLARPRSHRPEPEEARAAGGRGRVRIEIRPSPMVLVGDEIEVVVESERAGTLVLLDVDTAGRLYQLFPNRLSVQAGVPKRIRAGERVALPGRQSGLRVQAIPPVGRGMLIAVVSEDSAALEELSSRHKDLLVISRPEAYVVELSEVLGVNGPAGEAGAALRDNWTVGQLEYEIVPRRR